MARFRRSRLLCALLVQPVLAFALACSGHMALRCSVTGQVLETPCCPSVAGAEVLEQPQRDDSIDAPACCEHLTLETATARAAISEQTGQRLVLSGAFPGADFAAYVEPPAPIRRGCAPPRAARPPGPGTPIFLLTQSLLI